MNILNKLTKKNLVLNKKRTIVTIIGIVLATALIVCVSGMVTSFQETLVREVRLIEGNYHVFIKDMSKSDMLTLEHNRNVDKYYFMEDVGYAPFNSENDYKPYIYVMAYNNDALHNMGINLVEGRLPENKNEIIISKHLIDNGGYNKKIGDTITLEIGTRYTTKDSENVKLGQNNPLATDENEENPEELVKEKVITYKIVGIMNRPSSSIERFDAPGFTCVTYLEKLENTGNAAVLYKSAKNYKDKTKEIVGDKYGYTHNNELLRYLGVVESPTMNAIYSIATIVIGIIIITSVFVIKNSFDISITEKNKMYGMLRSVGATSKQIKKNVLYEGFILGLIAIPIGIICGIVAIVTLVFLINLIMGDYLNGIKFVYSIPLLPILFSIVLAGVTIYFSTIFTAIKAGKISAIEAIRSNNDIKIKNKKLRTPLIIKKIFRIGGVIAYKNLKRNKKKYRTTVISIVVSVFVFISLFSFIDLGFRSTNFYYKKVDYNVVFTLGSKTGNLDAVLSDKIMGEIASKKLVERYSVLKYGLLKINYNDYISDYGKTITEFFKLEQMNIMVVSVGEQEYSRYLKKLGKNPEELKNKGILIDEYMEKINNKNYMGNMYKVKNYDTMTGKIVDMNKGEEIGKELNIEVVRSNIRPMGLELANNIDGYLVISDDLFNENFVAALNTDAIYVQTKDVKKLIEEVKDLEKNYADVKIYESNIEESVKAMKAMLLICSIFLYGFITVISLIGITNIFNTITTNMNLRSKEFAILKSVGMTKIEFNKMIRLESIFYGFKSLVIGIPLGIVGSLLIFEALGGAFEIEYEYPIKAILIATGFVAIVIGMIMKYSLNKINKQNIIETIRNDNI